MNAKISHIDAALRNVNAALGHATDADASELVQSALREVARALGRQRAEAEAEIAAEAARETVAREKAEAAAVVAAIPAKKRARKPAAPIRAAGSDGLDVEVIPGDSIRLHGTRTNTVRPLPPVDRTYRIGDVAAYDGYNFTYTGTIVAIGRKTVTIATGSGDERRRLPFARFAFWNRYDLEHIARERHAWSD